MVHLIGDSSILDGIKVVFELCIWNMVNRDMFHLHVSFANSYCSTNKTGDSTDFSSEDSVIN